ncbi:MAG: DUF368 domain-containing protein [Candidatus Omnitrophica bacterium]|nr:DUF368 domain-containing protein [Candidatus Omnitrophota bacterium]
MGLKGFCMGIANSIPGVSGGTIAFIFGIYEDLIVAINSIDITLVKYILKRQWSQVKDHIPWRFLIFIFGGSILAIFSLSRIISWLLVNEPVLINAFFFGLIVATIPIIAKSISVWNIKTWLWLIVTTVAMYLLAGLVPVNTPNSIPIVMLSGALAICAMILPGISGAFILLLIGKYQYIINAVSDRNLFTITIVGIGCIVGLLTFVRVLKWLFSNYHDQTMASLTGLVIGSMRKIWPWKETLRSITSHKGEVLPIEQVNFIPAELTPEIGGAIGLFVFGLVIAAAMSMDAPRKVINK